MSLEEIKIIWKTIVPKLWPKVPQEIYTDPTHRTFQFVRLPINVNEALYISNAGYALDWHVRNSLQAKYGEKYSNVWAFTPSQPGHCHEPYALAMIEKIKSVASKEYDALYIKHKIAARAIAAVQKKQKAKQEHVEKRAVELTIPGQRAIAREVVLALLEQVVEDSNCPIKIDTTDLWTEYGRVYVRIKHPLTDYAATAFKGDLKISDVDRTGQKLFDSLKNCGLDTDKVLKTLLGSKDPLARQFAVMFTGNALVGLLDQNEVVRKTAEIDVKKRQDQKAESESES